jgi:hypothetical protein
MASDAEGFFLPGRLDEARIARDRDRGRGRVIRGDKRSVTWRTPLLDTLLPIRCPSGLAEFIILEPRCRSMGNIFTGLIGCIACLTAALVSTYSRNSCGKSATASSRAPRDPLDPLDSDSQRRQRIHTVSAAFAILFPTPTLLLWKVDKMPWPVVLRNLSAVARAREPITKYRNLMYF